VVRGEYPSWDEARRASAGYNDPAILERKLEATLQVARDEVALARGGAAFETPFQNQPLLHAWDLARGVADRSLSELAAPRSARSTGRSVVECRRAEAPSSGWPPVRVRQPVATSAISIPLSRVAART